MGLLGRIPSHPLMHDYRHPSIIGIKAQLLKGPAVVRFATMEFPEFFSHPDSVPSAPQKRRKQEPVSSSLPKMPKQETVPGPRAELAPPQPLAPEAPKAQEVHAARGIVPAFESNGANVYKIG